MKISIVALGSRGDTQPCVALAAGLIARGHQVSVIAPARYADLIRGVKATYRPMSIDPQMIVESEAGQELLTSGPLSFVRKMRVVIEPLAEQILTEIDQGCDDADLVLAPAMGGCGQHVSDRRGIPHALLHFQPSEPTAEFANPVITTRPLPGPVNRATYALIEAASWLLLARMTNRIRRRSFGLPGLRRSTFHRDRARRVTVLCGVSSAVVQRPRDWPENVHLTGFWLNPKQSTLGPELEAFLADGPPVVFIGFGSMATSNPEHISDSIRLALRRTGLRAVVQGLPAWPSVDRDGVLLVDEADHATLFPRMAAIVHHGGAGTTATAMRAGVPSVVCPFFGDQPFWAQRVADLGVGTAPAPIKSLNADVLTERLRAATGDPLLRANAARLGQLLAEEDGVGEACRIIEDMVLPTPRLARLVGQGAMS